MGVFALPFMIAFQLALSLGVYLSKLNKRPSFLIAMLVVNLVMGFTVPWHIGVFLWGFLLGLFGITAEQVMTTPLTGSSALTLLITLFVPILYFKSTCIPLVRDAAHNYGNYRRAQRAKEHQNREMVKDFHRSRNRVSDSSPSTPPRRSSSGQGAD